MIKSMEEPWHEWDFSSHLSLSHSIRSRWVSGTVDFFHQYKLMRNNAKWSDILLNWHFRSDTTADPDDDDDEDTVIILVIDGLFSIAVMDYLQQSTVNEHRLSVRDIFSDCHKMFLDRAQRSMLLNCLDMRLMTDRMMQDKPQPFEDLRPKSSDRSVCSHQVQDFVFSILCDDFET